MDRYEQIRGYDFPIRKIQKRRKCVIILTIILLVAVVLLTRAFNIEILDKTVFSTKGIHPAFTVLLVLLVLIFEIVAYAIVSMPLTSSLDVECDPGKYLALNAALTKKNKLVPIYTAGYFLMGEFTQAMVYAAQMIASGKPAWSILGLFYKARCEFLSGDYEAMKITVQQYEGAVSAIKNNKVYQKYHNFMILMCAIADNDKDKINVYSKSIQVWKNSKAVEGYVNYLRGISACYIGDKQESIYYFMAVKKNCDKTVLSQLADEFLLLLK